MSEIGFIPQKHHADTEQPLPASVHPQGICANCQQPLLKWSLTGKIQWYVCPQCGIQARIKGA